VSTSISWLALPFAQANGKHQLSYVRVNAIVAVTPKVKAELLPGDAPWQERQTVTTEGSYVFVAGGSGEDGDSSFFTSLLPERVLELITNLNARLEHNASYGLK
jgi:hypothetical protein